MGRLAKATDGVLDTGVTRLYLLLERSAMQRPFAVWGIDDGYRRARLSGFLLTHRDIQLVVDALQRAVPSPAVRDSHAPCSSAAGPRQDVPLATSLQD
jgi:hypothetical protein